VLILEVAMSESVNEETGEFVSSDVVKLELEHSLVTLSKWESKFEKPFLGTDKDQEQTLFYVQSMLVTPDVPDAVFVKLIEDKFEEINAYINAKMTATWFREDPQKKPNREIITSELIYYWMFSYGIPKECEHWHLERLLTLIRVFSEKNKPQKKMSRAEMARQQRMINEQRRAQYGTSG